jgi:hypothetical protein
MNKSFINFINALRVALKANQKVGSALKEFKPVYDKATPETQWQYRLQVAGVIASAYQCKARESVYRGAKTVAFDGDDRNAENARACMKYYFPVKPTAKTSNKVDPVKALLTSYGKLTSAEKRRFLAAI